jgi:hypothetical protein
MTALLLLVTVSGLAACGSTTNPSAEPPSSGPTTESAAASNGSVTETDPLSGIWESEPFSADQIDALLRDRFTDAQVDEFERTNPQHFSGYHKEVNQLHFAGDQLVITTSKDGGTAREGWTGAYAIQDAATFLAGGESGPLYIAVNFTIDGDRLTLDLIRDRLPDHSPWNAGDGIHPRSISRPVDDSMNATVIYDISSYTRVG